MTQETDVFAHRRGLMLGLTLAEVLMLVLFILLLTYTAIVLEKEKRLEAEQARAVELEGTAAALKLEIELGLSGLMARLEPLGLPVPDVQALEVRLREITAQIAQKDADNQKLSRLVPSPENAEKLAEALEKIPNAPAAEEILQKWLEENASEGEPSVELEVVSEGPKTLQEANAQIARLESQVDFFQATLDAAGNGLTYPPCWSRNGRAVFIYNVKLFDDFVRLEPGDNRTGQDLSALAQNGPELPMGEDLGLKAFLAGTSGLHAWSVDNRCRFYVRITDATSSSNKAGYRRALRTVEQHFYKFEVN